MLTSRQRSFLKALASKLSPTMSIGKEGVTESVIKQADNLLEARELIKISVQRGSELPSKQLIGEVADKLSAEPVIAIGNNIVLYRRSGRDVKHIELP
jgi:RNA-binding protein